MCIHTNKKVFTFSVTATMFSSTECKYIRDVLSGITIRHLCCYPLLDIDTLHHCRVMFSPLNFSS